MIQKVLQSFQTKFSSVKSIFIRYFLYGFALIESFALPKLIDNHNYSQYEYYKNFIFIFPYFLLGAHSGYVYLKYSFKVDYYRQLFSIGILITFFLAGAFALIFQKSIILLPLIIIGIYTISEQYLKIRKRYAIIFLFKPLLSVITVGLASSFLYFNSHYIEFEKLIIISFSLACLIWVLLCKDKAITFPFNAIRSISRFTALRYGFMVKVYFTGVLGSLMLSALIFFERYFTEKYYPETIATYSFAFNLSQIIVVALSAISYITSVELGEKKDIINIKRLKSQFVKAAASYAGFMFLFTVFLYLITPFYPEFNNLATTTLLITYAKGFFYLVGTVSHLAVYHGYNTRMFKGLLLFSILEVTLIMVLVQLGTPLPTLLFIDSIILISYSFYILDIVFNRIQYSGELNRP